jgi:hypothetical protein
LSTANTSIEAEGMNWFVANMMKSLLQKKVHDFQNHVQSLVRLVVNILHDFPLQLLAFCQKMCQKSFVSLIIETLLETCTEFKNDKDRESPIELITNTLNSIGHKVAQKYCSHLLVISHLFLRRVHNLPIFREFPDLAFVPEVNGCASADFNSMDSTSSKLTQVYTNKNHHYVHEGQFHNSKEQVLSDLNDLDKCIRDTLSKIGDTAKTTSSSVYCNRSSGSLPAGCTELNDTDFDSLSSTNKSSLTSERWQMILKVSRERAYNHEAFYSDLEFSGDGFELVAASFGKSVIV